MHKKRALVLWGYLCLLALAACGPKVVDDADNVSVDYVLSFQDGSVIDEWSQTIVIWDSEYEWLQSAVLWAKVDDEFSWNIGGAKIYGYLYDANMVQTYPNLIMQEVLSVENPEIWSEVFVNSFGTWVIVDTSKDEEWYDEYTVDFNDPKTYSELSYYVKVINIEKN